VQTKRLAASFVTFTGSVEDTGPEKFSKPRAFRLCFFSKILKSSRTPKWSSRGYFCAV